MVSIHLGADDVARVRFRQSALWETVAAVHAMTHRAPPALHSRALQRRLSLPAARALTELAPLGGVPGWVPDTLAAPPPGGTLDPRAELEAVLETDPEVVGSDLEVLRRAAPRTAWAALSPDAFVERLATALLAFWEHQLAPLWERVQAVTEADINDRQRGLARDGVGPALGLLHPQVRYGEALLTVDVCGGCQRTREGGAGVVLVPSVFRWPRVIASVEAPGPVVLGYPANGSGAVWDTGRTPERGVEALIGRTRARILAHVGSPCTTTACARHLDLAAATVSAHLTTLAAAGLVHREREGRLVLYSRTLLGTRLLGEEAADRALA